MIYLIIKNVPIQNIYYMLLYTWDRVKEKDNIDISNIKGNSIYDLLAMVLCKSVSKIIKKGINKEYNQIYEEKSSLRGKINFNDSLKRNSLNKGKAYCSYDEFSIDTINNQIIKATLYDILKSNNIDKSIKDDVMKIYRNFIQVSNIKLSNKVFNQTRIGKNSRHYKLSLDVCRLIYENSIPSEEDGKVSFKDFAIDDREMAYIFESFVRNFYKTHLNSCNVIREDIKWDAVGDNLNFLPKMQTDISIHFKDKVIIIDTKYYKSAMAYNMNSEKFYSNNLYQIFSYIKNAEAKGDKYLNSTGILLYPRVEKDINEVYDIQGHKIKLCTIDLNDEWENIHNNLLEIIKIDIN